MSMNHNLCVTEEGKYHGRCAKSKKHHGKPQAATTTAAPMPGKHPPSQPNDVVKRPLQNGVHPVGKNGSPVKKAAKTEDGQQRQIRRTQPTSTNKSSSINSTRRPFP
ncbi:unnamed protein product [Vitrella brassicaformis CCMP3155]|uniref:Uncharacterized protein n=1 Tax=Vitrella brassicaformis (strain CCMP3155) TaxID=1169540 RepID=A0A0G4EFW0_VITBC|nr:unnamed protein product [Vitrella brassicaformis CCMP3155]|eukprot:CEL94325.1 unnamed protein product [Vitrella brassicaformis CCMP3155]